MATIPYMPFYFSDHLADIAHLSTLEHGAYIFLIINYWQTGKPLPNDDKKLARICRLPLHKFTKLVPSLKEFFSVTETEWQHKRIEKELALFRHKSELARVKGQKSGEVRRNKKGTDAEPLFNHSSTDVELELNYKRREEEIREDNINTREVSSNTTVIKRQAEANDFTPAEVVPFPEFAASNERTALLLCLESLFPQFVAQSHRNNSKLIALINVWQDAKVVPEDIHAASNEIRTRDPTKNITSPLYFEKIVIEFASARINEGNYESCVRGNTRKLSIDEQIEHIRNKLRREGK